MTIVEALKKFYKGNAQNEKKLKEADSVLDAIRAKYGPYKGANVAEYLQTAMANGVTPSSGGGGMAIPTFTYGDEVFSCDMTLAEIETSISTNGGGSGTIPCKYIGAMFGGVDWYRVSVLPKTALEETGAFDFDADVTKGALAYIIAVSEDFPPQVVPYFVLADNGKYYEAHLK